jgi:hypothetical protein
VLSLKLGQGSRRRWAQSTDFGGATDFDAEVLRLGDGWLRKPASWEEAKRGRGRRNASDDPQ